ncbi:hypothetical protein DQ04_02101000, partial [Trypanosoma grayi]|uniref:hypothetical protein n=1 Tax=Trypanosoma grayi TaxID=71804 RepID=UPI0004F47EDA
MDGNSVPLADIHEDNATNTTESVISVNNNVLDNKTMKMPTVRTNYSDKSIDFLNRSSRAYVECLLDMMENGEEDDDFTPQTIFLPERKADNKKPYRSWVE